MYLLVPVFILHVQYFRLKEELRRLEEGDAPGQGGSSNGQERISFRDIDALTRDRGATLTRRQIEVSKQASRDNSCSVCE